MCRALYVTAICLGVVAYLAKPVAITVPLAALVIDRFILGRPWKKVLAWYAPWQVLLLPLVILTRSVSSVNAVGNMPIWSRVSVAGDALAWHLYKLVVPFKLGIDYGRTPQYVLSHWWGYATWIAPAALLAGGTILCRDRRLLAALGLWIVALLPDIGLVPFPFQQYSTVADRYDYLALIGPPFAVVVWLSSSRWRYAPATAGVVLVLLAGLSAAQSIIWKDTPALMAQALEVNPSSVLSRLSLASYDAAHGDTAHAEVLYVESIRLAPNDYHTHAGIGTLYVLLGRNADAARELQQAIALKPDCESAHLSQGVLLYEQGKFAAAIPEFKMALTADRLDLSARHNLARALVGAGRSADARLEIEIILMTDPDNKPALDFLKALAGDASRQRR